MSALFLQHFIQTSLRFKTNTSSGWRTCNGACCIYNNETADKKGRAGFLFENDGGIVFHCFNCSFSSNWVPGRPLSHRFKNLLKWFNIPQDKIDVLQFDALDLKVNGDYEHEEKRITALNTNFPESDAPTNSKTFSELADFSEADENFLDVVEYVCNRKVNIDKYDLMWTPNTDNDFNRNVIVPFYYNDTLVGYATRSIDKKLFKNQMPEGYVFNMDVQRQRRSRTVIVCEGLFDAMTIDAVAVLHNRINSNQAGIIETLNRDIIVVPDYDKSGIGLVEDALNNGWGVSFPIWAQDYKDINDAVKDLGKIFVLEQIFSSVVTNPIKIQILAKKYMKGNKNK